MDALRVPSLTQRPGSSLSNRSVSRASQRPSSRLSQRTITKQPRFISSLKTLVKQVAKIKEEDAPDDFQKILGLISKRLDQMRQATTPDSSQIDAQFRGHIKKARINVQNTLADALHAKYTTFKVEVTLNKHLEMVIDPTTVPNHLQLLVGD
ncbi:hypothetical protein K439DRAFT_1625920 [Ramaria rubella]|nr:hypothetical protein K439DRAFT_1625920 [Ramaria rubella]